VGEKGVVLKHHAHPTPFRRQAALGRGNELAAKGNAALNGAFKPSNQAQQGGFTAARRAK